MTEKQFLTTRLRSGLLIPLAVPLCLATFAAFGGEATVGQTTAQEAKTKMHFDCNALGYVRHWAVVGPQRSPYQGKPGNDDAMRREAVDKTIVEPPKDVQLGGPGPFNQKWQFYRPGENFFVECSSFYHELTTLDYYGVTEIEVAREVTLPARLWASGTADLWVNGTHFCRHDVPRYMRPDFKDLKLALKAGANRLCVRLQALGVRDTRMLFGLQLLDGAKDAAILLPASREINAQLVAADAWIGSIKPKGNQTLVCAKPIPQGAEVKPKNAPKAVPWPSGQTECSIPPAQSFQVTAIATVAGQKLERLLEIPANQPADPAAATSIDEHRRAYLEYMASPKPGEVLNLLARKLTKQRLDDDAKVLDNTLRGIDTRRDCSDFWLAVLLRMQALELTDKDEAEKIKRTALAFRYWMDEPGKDAMCFGSENHSLLFHGCQLIAGRLYPEETFTNSNKKGSELAAIGARRCKEWLEKTERRGFEEFLSSTYMPITVAALMNVVDFSGDQALSDRARALVDRIFNDLALQAFDGVTVGPQGRVYRNVLYPTDSGTQALLSFATSKARVARTHWAVFLSSSKTYTPPAGLDRLMVDAAAKSYRMADVEITLSKTPGYLLTSLQIPASFSGKDGKPAGLQPGAIGYQQHLWHATLGQDCHVFSNHPGGSFDRTSSRPGYWYGNGIIPRVKQDGGTLMAIYNIPETHPMPFTHAHWPADAFDRQEARGNWVFGQKGDGCVALWCSEPLTPHDDMLSGRELRANGLRAAWLCICGSAKESGGLEGFIKACQAQQPAFDAKGLSLKVGKGEGLTWK